jgi:hypothetical protein
MAKHELILPTLSTVAHNTNAFGKAIELPVAD